MWNKKVDCPISRAKKDDLFQKIQEFWRREHDWTSLDEVIPLLTERMEAERAEGLKRIKASYAAKLKQRTKRILEAQMTQHIKKQKDALTQHLEILKQQFAVKQQEKNEELKKLKDTKLVTKMRDYEDLKLKKLVTQKFWFNTPDSWEAFKSSAYQHSLAEEQLKK
jgi:DNA-binding transcriptional ArsR family regulator